MYLWVQLCYLSLLCVGGGVHLLRSKNNLQMSVLSILFSDQVLLSLVLDADTPGSEDWSTSAPCPTNQAFCETLSKGEGRQGEEEKTFNIAITLKR